ncbi:hypothetical protein BGZ73_006098 [Actinomortierella ambigua]|nr:hypothetical protein BGZ73_006098 [Actinomortierella ambigua]
MRYNWTLAALLAASVRAAQVNFRVFAPNVTKTEVSINGQLTVLTAADPNIPYFTGKAEAPDGATYKYVFEGQPETFDRQLGAGYTMTWNDFAHRPISYADIPELPWPIEERPQWTRGGTPHSLWDTNYIPTLWVQGDNTTLFELIGAPSDKKIPVTLTVVLADEIRTFKNVTLGIHGPGKKNNNAKQSWNMQLSPSDTLANRDFFKLRHMEEDPTQIREKLYADILQAMGTYVNEANMVRYYINGYGMGTFNLLDDITQYSFPRAMWYNGKPPAQMGALFDGASGASFEYDASGQKKYDSFKPNPDSPENYQAIDEVALAFKNAVKTDDNQIAEVDKLIDLDYFMRFMVMEYLTAHWDGYWELQTNIGLYRDPTDNNRWYFIGQDFDGTFGINAQGSGEGYVKTSYKVYERNFTNGILINGLLQNANQRTKFEKYLTNTVKVLFNNVTLGNRISKYHQFILEDLRWDRSLTQYSPGINYGWTFDHTIRNLYEWVLGTGNVSQGGAAWGLYPWIDGRAKAVAAEFNFEITKEPVGPPTTTPRPKPGQPTPNTDGGKADGKDPKSSAAALAPKALVVAVLIGAASFVSFF